MLRIHTCSSADAAKEYFTQSLARGDYYLAGQEMAGNWGGRGAELLGLDGEVTREGFFALCDARAPATGELLGQRVKENRRVGYDFTFSAKKGISLLYAATGDERIVEAMQGAVNATMQEAEADMATRVRIGGESYDRTTANMVWADFVHFTSRPVDGVPDPHLHVHCFAFNTTYDPVEERWKAGQFGSIKSDAPYFQAVFDNHLAHSLRGLGYEIERRSGSWDIAGLSPDLVRKFSRRTSQIEQAAKDRGVTDARAKGAIGAQLREAKSEEQDWETLREHWIARCSTAELGQVRDVIARAEPLTPTANLTDEAAGYALGQSFERRSVVPRRALLTEGLKRGVGHVTPAGLHEAMNRQGLLERTDREQVLCTTKAVLAEEAQMIAFARSGRGACVPLGVPEEELEAGLGSDQQEALRHILTSRDRVISVQGGAGTGKTTLMSEASAAIHATGKQVIAVAPSAAASRGVLREEGFSNADTVARLLVDKERQADLRGQILWVDEAGLLGSGDMCKLFAIAEEQEARVLLTGDVRQHAAVQRGDALRTLETHGGVHSVRVDQIWRQAGTYKEAVEALRDGEHADAWERLDRLGALHELDGEQRFKQLATDYADLIGASGADARFGQALVVSPTHAEGAQVTQAIREELRERGTLRGEDQAVSQLKALHRTRAELADASRYTPGEVVQVHRKIGRRDLESRQGAPGAAIEAGERLEVTGTVAGTVWARRDSGEEVALPLERTDRFSVYARRETRIAAGDQIRITQNGRTADRKHRLNNGSTYQVAEVTPAGAVHLTNGWKLAPGFGHLAHGYCNTSHSAQGRTVPHVLIAQGTASQPASSAEQLYVSASRGKLSLAIYTDDLEALKRATTASGERQSASDHFPSPTETAQPTLVERYATLRQQLSARVSSVMAWAQLGAEEWRTRFSTQLGPAEPKEAHRDREPA